jgi:prepilin-type N-terminal cleavage/methylation domain-containing protein/prepilin-type processing-associated H-X9-DG protein
MRAGCPGDCETVKQGYDCKVVKGVLPARPVQSGFSLVELLVTIAIIAILASLILPGLSKAKTKAHQTYCLNSLRQMGLATSLYADDFNDALPYNMGASEIKKLLAEGKNYNWAGSVLNWELDPDNTNEVLNTGASLGSYLGRNARVFLCPTDTTLSQLQREAGWRERTRTFSMNAMVGDAGEFLANGENVNNPHYHQYRKNREFLSASDIFIFIEEHPDSINDGYFLNRAGKYEWNDLPASWHNGVANLTFGDGHAEGHRWINEATRKPAHPDGADLPFPIIAGERYDFYWLMKRTTASEY